MDRRRFIARRLTLTAGLWSPPRLRTLASAQPDEPPVPSWISTAGQTWSPGIPAILGLASQPGQSCPHGPVLVAPPHPGPVAVEATVDAPVSTSAGQRLLARRCGPDLGCACYRLLPAPAGSTVAART